MTRAATATPGSRVAWIAARDGIAHAHEPRAARTRCGEVALDRRFAWPSLQLCPECVAAIENSTTKESR